MVLLVSLPKNPRGQPSHAEVFVAHAVPYRPAPQAVHAAAPAMGAWVPGSHAEQALRPALECVPEHHFARETSVVLNLFESCILPTGETS